MEKGFKNNPLACLLLGVILGGGGTLTGQALLDKLSTSGGANNTAYGIMGSQSTLDSSNLQKKEETNFDKIPYDENGDVVVTENGKKYHYEGCYTISQSKKIQRVNSSDAAEAGLEACSKCIGK